MGTSKPFRFIQAILLKMKMVIPVRFVYKSSIRSFVWFGG